ncbi:hypothetical protein L218DRAFT_951082 [Marasmius fiardii PR-910]|nr:hypothetical protein L218DRAFT_951082 [Marasmius fiardii PR-910]
MQFCTNEGGKLQRALQLIVGPFNRGNSMSPLQLCNSISAGLQSQFALEALLELNPGEAAALLSGLHSVLVVPESRTDDIVVWHASYSEFLLDQQRAGMYYVGQKLSDEEWRQLSTPSHEYPVNGIHDIDIGSLNVLYAIYTPISEEIALALDVFDPYLYLATVLFHWEYELVEPWAQYPHGFNFQVSQPNNNGTHKLRDWRYHISVVYFQIAGLRLAYNEVKKWNKSHEKKSSSIFIRRCTSFFSGFQGFPKTRAWEFVEGKNAGGGVKSTHSLQVKSIDLGNSQLLSKLLHLCTPSFFDFLRDSPEAWYLIDIFGSYEMEEWRFEIVRLLWSQKLSWSQEKNVLVHETGSDSTEDNEGNKEVPDYR